MRILITVGTTSFDSLIRFLDNEKFTHKYEFIFQIADGKYTPRNHKYFRFNQSLWDDFKDVFVITHSGAGSIYYLLENSIKFITIPNLERVDQHQLDIANFLKNQHLATVCINFSELKNELLSQKFITFINTPYEKDFFFKGKEITNLLLKD